MKWFYSGDLIKKIRKLDSIFTNANFVIADVLGLYPSIPKYPKYLSHKTKFLEGEYLQSLV